MICFCAERFQWRLEWRRLWQNPGEPCPPDCQTWLLAPSSIGGPPNPRTLLVKHGSQFFAIRLRRHRRARATRCASTRRTVQRSSRCRRAVRSSEAREFAKMHGGWIAARLRPPAEGRAVPSRHCDTAARRAAPDRASLRRARHGVGRNPRQRRDTFSASLAMPTTPTAASMTILKREARKDAAQGVTPPMRKNSASGSSGCRSAINRAAGAPARRRDHCRFPGG